MGFDLVVVVEVGHVGMAGGGSRSADGMLQNLQSCSGLQNQNQMPATGSPPKLAYRRRYLVPGEFGAL